MNPLWILEGVVLGLVAYQSVISIAGWIGRKKPTPIPDEPSNRFVCFICAHNEEAVVGQIARNLSQMDYPSHLYDIVVLADNCTDRTADVAREAGAIVWERFDDTRKSKGYALDWAFTRLWTGLEGDYDAVCVFDADNLVSPNFLRLMDAEMQAGGEIMQGYLDSKNPKDSWVTKSYAISYWATNRIYQMARARLGLTAQLGGTGMCLSTAVLWKHAWGTESLTEDLEYVARYVLSSGKSVRWVHEAKVYDEKPLKLAPSMVQRSRWARGHIECALTYTWPLLKAAGKAFRQGQWKALINAIDVVMYLIQPSRMALSTFLLTAFLFSLILPIGVGGDPILWVGTLSAYYLIPIVGLIQEKRIKRVAWLVLVYMFALTWIPAFWRAVFTRKQKSWNKTVHTQAIDSIEEIAG